MTSLSFARPENIVVAVVDIVVVLVDDIVVFVVDDINNHTALDTNRLE